MTDPLNPPAPGLATTASEARSSASPTESPEERLIRREIGTVSYPDPNEDPLVMEARKRFEDVAVRHGVIVHSYFAERHDEAAAERILQEEVVPCLREMRRVIIDYEEAQRFMKEEAEAEKGYPVDSEEE